MTNILLTIMLGAMELVFNKGTYTIPEGSFVFQDTSRVTIGSPIKTPCTVDLKSYYNATLIAGIFDLYIPLSGIRDTLVVKHDRWYPLLFDEMDTISFDHDGRIDTAKLVVWTELVLRHQSYDTIIYKAGNLDSLKIYGYCNRCVLADTTATLLKRGLWGITTSSIPSRKFGYIITEGYVNKANVTLVNDINIGDSLYLVGTVIKDTGTVYIGKAMSVAKDGGHTTDIMPIYLER